MSDPLRLKEFQERSLGALRSYLRTVDKMGGDAAGAFYKETGRTYLKVGGLERAPYVCLRVPTGGGKTLMACHALGILRDELIERDDPLFLWLVPSTPILDQTLDRLRDRADPYRRAAEKALGPVLNVASVEEALAFTPADLDGGATVVVGTIQKFRVEAKEGRAVYKSNGSLMPHFGGLDEDERAGLERQEVQGGDAFLPRSLANVFRLHRPAVVMDEAHKARTALSFATLSRFNPSAILELTATPGMETKSKAKDKPLASNVLHSTSAAELKAEEMVKLPVVLRTHPDWKQALGDALALRRGLEKAAERERLAGAPYLRPILLVQTEDRGGDKTMEVVLASLKNDFRLADEEFVQEAYGVEGTKPPPGAGWTGLLDPACPVRVVVTVDQLREGWDCPFAAVLCSLRGSKSGTAVTQLVGRVLRQPGAKRREDEQLNRAYVFADTADFVATLTGLKEAIVAQGFEKQESKDLVRGASEEEPPEDGLFFEGDTPLAAEPTLTQLCAELRQRVAWTGSADRERKGAGTLTVRGRLSAEEGEALVATAGPADRAAVERLVERAKPFGATDGAKRDGSWDPTLSTPLRIPALAIREAGDAEPRLFDRETLAERPWSLAGRDPTLTTSDFPTTDGATRSGLVDVDPHEHGGHVFTETQGDLLVRQQKALYNEPDWTPAELVLWLDRAIDHPDLTLSEAQAFLHRVLQGLTDDRRLRLDLVAARRFKLKRAAEALIARHRQAARTEAYEATLFGEGLPGEEPAAVEVGDGVAWVLDADRYVAGTPYTGSHRFGKHAFETIGSLGDGEEFRCAVHLDAMPAVKRWVRNPDRSFAPSAFRLPLPGGGNFHPDFVAELHDGRWLVVEYKGEDRLSNDNSKAKLAVGDLWAARSGGRCVFVMVSEERWGEIDEAIN